MTTLQNPKLLVIFGVGLVSGAIALTVVQSLQNPASDASKTVARADTALESAPGGWGDGSTNKVSALGRLAPKDKVIQVAAPSTAANARIEALRIQEGDRVEAKQVIAVLDTYTERQAQLLEATTQLKNAQAQLDRVKAGASPSEIQAQKALISQLQAQTAGDLQAQSAQIARLQAEYDNAVAEADRYQTLFATGAVSESTWDSQRTAMLAAQERLQEAQKVFTRLQSTGQSRIQEAQATLDRIAEVRPVDIAVAETAVETAIAAQARAAAALQQAQILAPAAGQILQIHARPGEVVGADGVVTLGQTDAMYALAEVYEGDIDRVAVGQRAIVRSEYGGFEGELAGIVEQVGLSILDNSLYDPNPTALSDSRIVEVRIRLAAEDSDRVSNLTNLQVQVEIGDS